MAWFPERNLSLLSIFNFKFHMYVVFVHGPKPLDFQRCDFQNGRRAAILDFSGSGL